MPLRCDAVEIGGVVAQAVACTSVPGWLTVVVARLDCAPRFCSSACRKACSEAELALFAVPVEVEPLPAALLQVVDPVVVGVVPAAAPVLLALEPVAVDDVAAVLPDPAGVSALTSAWKSCCSFVSALLAESDEDPDEVPDADVDGVLDRPCSRLCKPLARLS